jgi:hypothetical protein
MYGTASLAATPLRLPCLSSGDARVTSQTDNPEFWRFRAEGARTLAEEIMYAEPKAIMNRIAEDYERIAILFEESARKPQ